MIIPNATAEFRRPGQTRLDPSTGFPSPQEGGWSEGVECQILPVRSSLTLVVSGERATAASLDILFDSFSIADPLSLPETLRLTDREGRSLGTYRLTESPEPLEGVGQVRLRAEKIGCNGTDG